MNIAIDELNGLGFLEPLGLKTDGRKVFDQNPRCGEKLKELKNPIPMVVFQRLKDFFSD